MWVFIKVLTNAGCSSKKMYYDRALAHNRYSAHRVLLSHILLNSSQGYSDSIARINRKKCLKGTNRGGTHG